MANRLVEGWKDWNINYPQGTRAATFLLVDTPYTFYSGDNNGTSLSSGISITSDGYLRMVQQNTTSGNPRMVIGRPVSDFVTTAAATVLFGGFRVKSSPTFPLQTAVMFGLWTKSTPLGSGNYQNLLLWSDVGTFTPNTEYYVEWSIDISKSTIYFRVDGGAILSRGIASTYIASGTINNWSFGWGGILESIRNGTSMEFNVKDIYVNEKLATGGQNGYLGPIQLLPIYVDSVTGTSTVVGAADAKAALNTPISDVATFNTPLVTTDPVDQSLELKMTVQPFYGIVRGVSLNVSAKRAPGSYAGLKVSVETDDVTSDVVSIPLAANMKVNIPFFANDSSPDNKPWTRASLLASTVKLTASNS